MDGENNGKPYEQMDDLGVKNIKKPYFWFNTHMQSVILDSRTLDKFSGRKVHLRIHQVLKGNHPRSFLSVFLITGIGCDVVWGFRDRNWSWKRRVRILERMLKWKVKIVNLGYRTNPRFSLLECKPETWRLNLDFKSMYIWGPPGLSLLPPAASLAMKFHASKKLPP